MPGIPLNFCGIAPRYAAGQCMLFDSKSEPALCAPSLCNVRCTMLCSLGLATKPNATLFVSDICIMLGSSQN